MTSILGAFDGYTLRAVTEADRPALEEWIKADPWHEGILDANFFLGRNRDGQNDSRATCCALEDENGVVFFIRLSRAARVNIQFAPSRGVRRRKRIAEGLFRGMAYLEGILQKVGCEQWIFDTGDARLAETARRHMAFEDSPNEMVRQIEPGV